MVDQLKQENRTARERVEQEELKVDQLLINVDQEEAKLKKLKKYAAGKRKSVIPADQAAADKAEAAILEKEVEMTALRDKLQSTNDILEQFKENQKRQSEENDARVADLERHIDSLQAMQFHKVV